MSRLLAARAMLDARIGRVRQVLADHQLSGLLVSCLSNLFYLTNFQSSAGAALLTGDTVLLAVDFRYLAALDRLVADLAVPSGFHIVRAERSSDETLLEPMARLTGRLGVEAEHLSVGRFEWLSKRLAARGAGAELVAVEGVVERVRRVKDAHELTLLAEAGRRLSGVASKVLAEVVSAGRREDDVAADIDWQIRHAGFARPAFETIVASGPNAASPHARPTDRVIRSGDLVVLDFGGVYGGYCVDLTRTVGVGRVADPVRRLYDAVREAQDAAIGAIAPGVAAADVDRAAREVLTRHGLAEAFGHATGHGLGIDVHEAPRIGRALEGARGDVLERGMVFTVEPGAYVPGLGGVRIEDDVVVGNRGAELLTDVPRDFRAIQG